MGLLLIGWLAQQAHAQTPASTNYYLDNGLPSSTVYGIMEDHRGFMWFATESGASSYDGHTFTNYTVTDGLSGNDVLSVFEDSHGRIWFLPFNQNISYLEDGRVHNCKTDPWLKPIQGRNFITAHIEDGRGNLWFSDDAGIVFCLKPDSSVIVDRTLHDYYARNFRAFFLDAQGDVIAVSAFAMYNLTQGCTLSELDEGYGQYYAPRAVPLSDGRMLIAIGQQFKVVDGSKVSRMHVTMPQGFGEVMSARPSGKHGLWLTTRIGAIRLSDYALSDSNLVAGKMEIFLPGKAVSEIYEDHEGNYWMSTLGEGIFFFSSLSAKTYDSPPGSSTNFSNKVLRDSRGRIWVGFDRALLAEFRDDHLEFSHLPDTSHGRGRTNAMYEDRAGNVFVFSDAAYTIIGQDGRLWPRSGGGKAFTQLADGRYFVAHSWEVDSIGRVSLPDFEQTYIDVRLDPRALVRKRTQSLLGTRDGRLLMGTLEGLLECPGTDYTWHAVPEVPPISITSVKESADGVIWIASLTQGGGYLYHGKYYAVTASDGLASDICYDMTIDSAGTLYFATNAGISKVEVLDYASKRLRIHNFGKSYGLASNEVRSVAVGGGKIYAATAKGLTVLNADFLEAKAPKVPVHITEFQARGQKVDFQGGNLVLQPDQNRISISITGISYRSPEKVRFRYQLAQPDGDTTWILTQSRQLEFPALSPGHYVLRVQAMLDGHPETLSETVARFEILPRFYQTTWFYALISLTGAIALSLLFWLVIRRLRAQERKRMAIQQRIAASDQRALRAQMNPHFIFNSLNSIEKFFLTSRPAEANAYIADFSDLMRGILDLSAKSAISLSQELRFMSLFLNLERQRMDQRFTFSIECAPEIEADMVMVPSLMLQPFVENAVWHGLGPRTQPGGYLRLSAKEAKGGIEICIEDNGIGRTRSAELKLRYRPKHKSSGMRITQERIDLLNIGLANPFRLTIEDLEVPDGECCGTRVRLFVPEHFKESNT